MKIQRIISIGVLIFLTNVLAAQEFTNYDISNSGLPDNYINGGVAIDQDNNKWFGTGAGVAKFDDVTWTVYTTNEGIIDDYITCIAVDANNNIWIGTDLGASKFDGTSWTSYTSADGLITDGINDIRGDLAGNVWFATYAGLSMFDGTNFTNFTTADGLSIDLLTNLSSDAEDNIWIGTLGEGITKYDGTSFTNFGASSNIIDLNITAITIDHLGNKWVGTFYGASVFNSDDLWVTDYTVVDGLYGEYVRDIEEDSQGNIWFGIFVDYLFDGAVTKFDGTSWMSYAVPQGLIDNQVKRLAIDQQDNVWIATGNGVSKLENTPTNVELISSPISLNIYPNPANQFLNIKVDKAAVSNKQQVKIVNYLGQRMDEFSVVEKDTYSISLEKYTEGMYFITVGQNVSKFIVKK
ncbi:MAG: two-component regulator propeller domain-containing protein [Lentimicrobium sp.]|jgi:ligand-binding sensor domain-containing protein|nr:two-component regulator propeller domain-containing protein [Lentimicrobium sp.]